MHGSVRKEENWKPQIMAVMVAIDLLLTISDWSSVLSIILGKSKRTKGPKDGQTDGQTDRADERQKLLFGRAY
jgi:hypothetical protein